MAMFGDQSLRSRLNAALPKGTQLFLHHIISPAESCDAIFAAPPGEQPEGTTCEYHLLLVSINKESNLIHAFAIEVLIYETNTLTTLFVSKADSTGSLYSLGSLERSKGPIKATLSEFLSYLIDLKECEEKRLVVSLFARAQAQYLFPGSVENKSKHVLDDRGLIRWWCSVLDDVLKKRQGAGKAKTEDHGYLRVPGYDVHETRAFFPKASTFWSAKDPLRSLGKPAVLPERCLVPRFPDDPKARFVIDLDDELPENGPQPMDSPAKNKYPGKWRSVRSLEQFWELMSYRQECAAGRLVGFLWAVLEPQGLVGKPFEARVQQDEATRISLPTPVDPQHPKAVPADIIAPLSTSESVAPSSELPGMAKALAINLNDSISFPLTIYSDIIDYLLELDYSTLQLAQESTQKLTSMLAAKSGRQVDSLRCEVVGLLDMSPSVPLLEAEAVNASAAPVAMLVPRRKRKVVAAELSTVPITSSTDGVRDDSTSTNKRAKTEDMISNPQNREKGLHGEIVVFGERKPDQDKDRTNLLNVKES